MSLQPFLDAPTHIQIHAACATLAIALGPVAIYRRRRDMIHKVSGYVWIVAMLTTAITSFWIHSFAVIGPFSPIHLLAILAIWSIFQGMRAIFRGNVTLHRAVFRNLYWNGLMVAGLLNFLPGRTTARSFLGPDSALNWAVIAVGGAFLAYRLLRGKMNLQVAA